MTVVVAPICGPILGGWISDNYHWGWIFFINVPLGILVVVIAMQTLKGRETKTEIRPIDIANRLKNDYILCPDMRQRSIAGCYQNNVAWL